jgi:NitT/TauT family transport system substrate-binding protein
LKIIWRVVVKKLNIRSASKALLAAMVVALFAGCTTQAPPAADPGASPAASAAANPQAQKAVRVQLSFLMQSLDAPLIVAINKGYFAEEGLNVSYERGFGNADTISKLGSGNFDLAFSDMYNALEFNVKNPSSKVMAVAMTQNKAPFAVLALKSSGINSPQDLAGKKLGAPAGDGPRKLFPLFASEVGLDPKSVEWITMEPKLRESFLLKGQVDAISGFVTSALPSLLKGGKTMDDINIFYYTDNGLDFYGNAILTRAEFAEKNPDAVKAFIKAYLRGMQDVIKDPSAGLDAVLAADESKLMDRNAEKERLKIALERMYITPEAEKNGLGSVDTARLEKTLEQTATGFNLGVQPKIADIFTEEFLPPIADRQMPATSDRQPLN